MTGAAGWGGAVVGVGRWRGRAARRGGAREDLRCPATLSPHRSHATPTHAPTRSWRSDDNASLRRHPIYVARTVQQFFADLPPAYGISACLPLAAAEANVNLAALKAQPTIGSVRARMACVGGREYGGGGALWAPRSPYSRGLAHGTRPHAPLRRPPPTPPTHARVRPQLMRKFLSEQLKDRSGSSAAATDPVAAAAAAAKKTYRVRLAVRGSSTVGGRDGQKGGRMRAGWTV